MQYLILHKVRGEPSFDIAEKAQIGNEEGWVPCTCGHRAYPYANVPLEALGDGGLDKGYFDLSNWKLPDDWPDHYAQHPEPKIKVNVLELVSKMLPKLKRRI